MTDQAKSIYSVASSTCFMGNMEPFPTKVRSIKDLRLAGKLENTENSIFKKTWNNINHYFDPFPVGEDATTLIYVKKVNFEPKPETPLITVFDRNQQSMKSTNANSNPSNVQNIHQIACDACIKKEKILQKKRPRIVPQPDQFCAQFYQSFIVPESPKPHISQSKPDAFKSKPQPQSGQHYQQIHQSMSPQPLPSKPSSPPKSAPISFKPLEKENKNEKSSIERKIERNPIAGERRFGPCPIEAILKQQLQQSSELKELLLKEIQIEPKEPARIIPSVVVVDKPVDKIIENEKGVVAVDEPGDKLIENGVKLIAPLEISNEATAESEKSSSEHSVYDEARAEERRSFINITPASVFLQAIGYNSYFFDKLDKGHAEFKVKYDKALEKKNKARSKQILNFYKSGTPDNINQASKLMFEKDHLQSEKSVLGEFPPKSAHQPSETVEDKQDSEDNDKAVVTKSSMIKLHEEYENAGEDLASMTFPNIPGLYEEFDMDDVIYRFDGSESEAASDEAKLSKKQETESKGSSENLKNPIPTYVNSSPPQINLAQNEDMDFELEILKSSQMSAKVAESQKILAETENDMMNKINEYLNEYDMNEKSDQVEKEIFSLMMPQIQKPSKASSDLHIDFGMDDHLDQMLEDYQNANIAQKESKTNTVEIDEKCDLKQVRCPTPVPEEVAISPLEEITPSQIPSQTANNEIGFDLENDEVPVFAVKVIHSNTNLTSANNSTPTPAARRPSQIPIRQPSKSRQPSKFSSTYSSLGASPSTSLLLNPIRMDSSTATLGSASNSISTRVGGPVSLDDRPIMSSFNPNQSRLDQRPRARTSGIPVRRPQTTSSSTTTSFITGPSFIPFTPPPSAIPKRTQQLQQSAASRRTSYSRNLNMNNNPAAFSSSMTRQQIQATYSTSNTRQINTTPNSPIASYSNSNTLQQIQATYSTSNTRQINTTPSSTPIASYSHSNTRQQLKEIPITSTSNMINLTTTARSLPQGHNINNNCADSSSSKENSSLPQRASTRVYQKRVASKDKPYSQIMAEKRQYALLQEQLQLEKRQRRENNNGSGNNTPRRSQSPRF